MPLHFFKKKEKEQTPPASVLAPTSQPTAPISMDDFKIMRTDTSTEEQIYPPSPDLQQLEYERKHPSEDEKKHRRLSTRLHIRGHSRNNSESTSQNIPADLVQVAEGDNSNDKWELRASQLAHSAGGAGDTRSRSSTITRSRSPSISNQAVDAVCTPSSTVMFRL